jgi:hypothetical protein
MRVTDITQQHAQQQENRVHSLPYHLRHLSKQYRNANMQGFSIQSMKQTTHTTTKLNYFGIQITVATTTTMTTTTIPATSSNTTTTIVQQLGEVRKPESRSKVMVEPQ